MIEIRRLDDAEQPLVLPLLGRCFPEYWEQIAATRKQMPFDEISFAAFSGEHPVGHCGVVVYRVSDGAGSFLTMGGIASVAVAPAFRGRKIAASLCETVADWAEREPGMVSLPLYTGVFRVYESVGWRRFDPAPPEFAGGRGRFIPLEWKPGAALDEAEKVRIAMLYAAMPDYPGKVVRSLDGHGITDWPRIFAEPGFSFAPTCDAYAIRSGETLAEAGFLPDLPDSDRMDFLTSALGPEGSDMLLPPPSVAGIELERGAAHGDPMHGERVMVRELKGRDFHRKHPDIFYSLIDKF